VLPEYSNPHGLKIVAMCKTFAGSEFLAPMLLSIYPFIDRIVFINSSTSWIGGKGNTCIKEIDALKNIDRYNKVISLDYDTTDQLAQCRYGFEFIKKNLNADYILLCDTDEVWDHSDLERALNFIHARPNHKVYRCQMKTYIKNPLYRLTNIEMCKPVVFVNARLSVDDMARDFRCGDLPGIIIPGVFMHHFIHVRKDFNSVFEKIIASHASEGDTYQDMSRWITEVWNRLPDLTGEWKAKGFHPNSRYPGSWKGIEVVSPDEWPSVLQNNSFPILEQFGIVRPERVQFPKDHV
jgi:hypothetical protein